MIIGTYTKSVDFEFQKELSSQGANSYVFLGRDKQLDNTLLYKRIEKCTINSEDYFKEARLLCANRHQYIVNISYGCYDDKYVYVGMPFYKKGSIKDKISKGNTLTPKEVIRYATHFLTGLNHIHSKGLIHFDIKPDNILISDEDEALLSDFGLAKQMESGVANPDKIYKMHYTPEYLSSLPSDTRSDIYQVGLTLYRMLNGHETLNNQFQEKCVIRVSDIIDGKFPDRKRYLSHIPSSLIRIVNKCLNPNPNDRYNTVLELLNDLGSIPVNNNLTWKYTRNSESEEWIRIDTKGIKYCVTLKYSGNYSIFVTKESKKRKQQLPQYCYNNINENQKDKSLKKIFKEL